MPYREQPLDPVYQPPSYREPDYTQDAEVTPLQEGGFIVWQDPDRLVVFKNREVFMEARELVKVEAPPVVARDFLKLLHAADSKTYTVDGPDLAETIRGWYSNG